MSDQSSKQFIEQAQQSLGGGQIVEALDFAQQAAALDPESADAHMLCGIALSQLNRPIEAEESFTRSATLNPGNPKLYYNWAVHYYSLGKKQEALNASRRALDLDPSHASSRDLVIRLEGELGMRSSMSEVQVPPVPFSQQPPAMPQQPMHYYGGYEPPLHGIRWVEKLGSKWDLFGWLCGGLHLIVMIINVMQSSAMMSDAMSNPNSFLDKIFKDPNAYQNGAATFTGLLGYLFVFALLFWLIVDILDRRASWVWLLPYFVFCCCSCTLLDWIILPLYIFVGRPKFIKK